MNLNMKVNIQLLEILSPEKSEMHFPVGLRENKTSENVPNERAIKHFCRVKQPLGAWSRPCVSPIPQLHWRSWAGFGLKRQAGKCLSARNMSYLYEIEEAARIGPEVTV